MCTKNERKKCQKNTSLFNFYFVVFQKILLVCSLQYDQDFYFKKLKCEQPLYLGLSSMQMLSHFHPEWARPEVFCICFGFNFDEYEGLHSCQESAVQGVFQNLKLHFSSIERGLSEACMLPPLVLI